MEESDFFHFFCDFIQKARRQSGNLKENSQEREIIRKCYYNFFTENKCKCTTYSIGLLKSEKLLYKTSSTVEKWRTEESWSE